MSKMIESSIECPFYLSEGDKFISCEGLVKGAKCYQSFLNNDLKRHYEESVCSVNCGKKCHHYRAVSLLYERGQRA